MTNSDSDGVPWDNEVTENIEAGLLQEKSINNMVQWYDET